MDQEDGPTDEQIPRPAGSAGNNFNIQNEMGLPASCGNNHGPRHLPAQKQNFTQWHPCFGHFVNDWATEEIVKQFIKNKHRRSYRQKWLDKASKKSALKKGKKSSGSKSTANTKGKGRMVLSDGKESDKNMPDASEIVLRIQHVVGWWIQFNLNQSSYRDVVINPPPVKIILEVEFPPVATSEGTN
ncbi:hypothetical protein B0H10DRAFT_1944042 [Mycena sp. CBHHK59/15]|nr:hypothetical protein B0H10DRAFT_1944042 [Mycena sp. CBHHK59/15]